MSVIVDNGLKRDGGIIMINTPVEFGFPIKNIISDLDQIAQNPSALASQTQYSFKGGRYVLQTIPNISTAVDNNALFDLDSWFEKLFYTNILYWYSIRKAQNKIFTTNLNDFQLLPLSPVTTANGLVPTTIPYIIGNAIGGIVFTNKLLIAFSVKFNTEWNLVGQGDQIFHMTGDQGDPLSVYLYGLNCLQIDYNGALYVVRLTKPLKTSSIVIYLGNLGTLMPIISVHVDSVKHIEEFLQQTTNPQQLAGVFSIASAVSNAVTFKDILACNFDTGEVPDDYAYFRALGEASSPQEFFGKKIFNHDSVLQNFTRDTLKLDCITGYAQDQLGRPLLNNGTLYRSWVFQEQYVNLTFRLTFLNGLPLSSNSIIITCGILSLRVINSNLQVYISGTPFAGHAGATIANNGTYDINLVAKINSRDLTNSTSTLHMFVNNEIIYWTMNSTTVNQIITSQTLDLSNTSAQLQTRIESIESNI